MRLIDHLRTYIDKSANKKLLLDILTERQPSISPLTPEVDVLIRLMHEKIISMPDYLEIRQ